MKATMKRKPAVEVYRDARGEWRWRLRAANGRIIADSAEGYRDRRGVDRAVTGLLRDVPVAMVREE